MWHYWYHVKFYYFFLFLIILFPKYIYLKKSKIIPEGAKKWKLNDLSKVQIFPLRVSPSLSSLRVVDFNAFRASPSNCNSVPKS